MAREYSEEISRWRYSGKYSVYDFEPTEDTVRELMNGDYFACLDENEALTGFVCFGASARIPAREADAYDEHAMDIGLGMRPDLCGRGNGAAFFSRILADARDKYPGCSFRLTVAACNERAMRVYERSGFSIARMVEHARSGKAFYIMVCEETTEA